MKEGRRGRGESSIRIPGRGLDEVPRSFQSVRGSKEHLFDEKIAKIGVQRRPHAAGYLCVHEPSSKIHTRERGNNSETVFRCILAKQGQRQTPHGGKMTGHHRCSRIGHDALHLCGESKCTSYHRCTQAEWSWTPESSRGTICKEERSTYCTVTCTLMNMTPHKLQQSSGCIFPSFLVSLLYGLNILRRFNCNEAGARLRSQLPPYSQTIDCEMNRQIGLPQLK